MVKNQVKQQSQKKQKQKNGKNGKQRTEESSTASTYIPTVSFSVFVASYTLSPLSNTSCSLLPLLTVHTYTLSVQWIASRPDFAEVVAQRAGAGPIFAHKALLQPHFSRSQGDTAVLVQHCTALTASHSQPQRR